MKYLTLVLRILLGAAFVLSAILKLFPISAFDARILEISPFLGWTFSMIFARLIIAIELIMGIFIIAGAWLRRVIYPLTLLMLGLFTSIVIYSLIIFGNQANCGCFGELLPFSNLQSLIKNGILILVTIFLFYNTKVTSLKYWWIGLIGLAISIFTIFMLHKIPIYMGEIELKKEITADYVYHELYQIPEVDLNEKHLAIFVTNSCARCKEMIGNFETWSRIYELSNTYIFVKQDTMSGDNFFAQQELTLPYQFILPDTFDKYLFLPYLPMVCLVDSGKLRRIWTGASFNYDRELPILIKEGIIRKK